MPASARTALRSFSAPMIAARWSSDMSAGRFTQMCVRNSTRSELPQRVDDFGRLHALRVLGRDVLGANHSIPVEEEGGGNRQVPGAISVELRDVLLEDIQVHILDLGRHAELHAVGVDDLLLL